ncbi:hypothetical protein [Novosphingobium album (ex Liu et al. 2023)]|uniref:hypothetical protein n=1 Tax=Novosphingobium album (ex Liu et al. 2023) TaxID=3031130 RepID=UPI0023AF1124|nr:hypothetical protein [Novosphingobium album (ex Liu et al. 2023)]
MGRLVAAAFLASGANAYAHEAISAPTPEGGLGWQVLASSEVIPWQDEGTGREHIRPGFSPEVLALRDKPVTLAGFMMPLAEGEEGRRHFLLFASAPDCLFHMSVGPTQFVEVRTDRPVEPTERALVLRGTMRLVDENKGGVFYRIDHGQLVSVL